MKINWYTAAVLTSLLLAGCGSGSTTTSGALQRSACDYPDGWGRTVEGGCNIVKAEQQWTDNHRAYHNAVGWQHDPRDWHGIHGILLSRFSNPVLDHSCTNSCVGGAH